MGRKAARLDLVVKEAQRLGTLGKVGHTDSVFSPHLPNLPNLPNLLRDIGFRECIGRCNTNLYRIFFSPEVGQGWARRAHAMEPAGLAEYAAGGNGVCNPPGEGLATVRYRH